MSDDKMSFEEACREIGVTEAELESLVAAGEIASIKEGDTLYFKKDVVRKFKKQRQDDATLLLSDDELNLLDEEPLSDIDLLADDEDTGPAKAKGARPAPPPKEEEEEEVQAVSISADDLLESDDLAEIRLDDDDLDLETADVEVPSKSPIEESEGDETLLSLDGLLEDDDSEATTPVPGGGGDATLMDTDLLDLGGDADPFTADTAEETSLGEDMTEVGTLLRGGGSRVMQMKRKKPHTAFTILLAVSSLLLIPSVGVFLNLLFTGTGDTQGKGVPPPASYSWILDSNVLQGAIESIADFFRSP